jgi:hypothetical protein
MGKKTVPQQESAVQPLEQPAKHIDDPSVTRARVGLVMDQLYGLGTMCLAFHVGHEEMEEQNIDHASIYETLSHQLNRLAEDLAKALDRLDSRAA